MSLEPCASVHGLPKSNQRQEDGISHATTLDPARFDRRAIPDDATERKWKAGDGHEVRLIEWPEPPAEMAGRGSILFMAGRADAYEKYLETFEHWRLKGWRVMAADWRGQGGSGRLGLDDSTGHIDDFQLWLNDLAELWSHFAQGRDGPLVLAAHSMGGHLVVRAAIEKILMPRPDALVLSAPMLDVFPEILPLPLKRLVSTAMAGLGDARRPAWRISEKPGSKLASRQRLLTHDDARYEDEKWWRKQRPELRLGPGSWGWVKAAALSSSEIFRKGRLEEMDIPTFIVATDADRLVSPSAVRSALARLPDADALIFGEEARHEILREEDVVREQALGAIDGFLDSQFSD